MPYVFTEPQPEQVAAFFGIYPPGTNNYGFIKKAVITYSYKVFRIIQELLENDYEHFVYQKSIELNGKSDTKRTG
jgi:hypothetical protein